MKTFDLTYRELRRQNRKNYLLLAGCCFFSVLLITAYMGMMSSPTVLSVLPEGGDSRKQAMMIFVLAVIGCGVFTTYASGLFFRSRAHDIGVFLVLGAPRALLRRELMRELAVLTCGSCAAGAVLGLPLTALIWQIFRATLVDTPEMALRFDSDALLFALAFSLFVIIAVFSMGARFIRRANIIEVVNDARRSEPIREVKHWYGKVGVLLIVVGGVLGYQAPAFFIFQLNWYPPEGLTAIFYAPLLVGMYMVLLHTVVNGWGGRKRRYKNIISSSMMKFQGRQTVRNMLVITVLIAGAYFAVFYTPMLGTGAMIEYQTRSVDYAFHVRADQTNVPDEAAVRALAAEQGVTITSYAAVEQASLAIDGERHVEHSGKLGTTYEVEYQPQLSEEYFLSESAYTQLTGAELDVAAGCVVPVLSDDGDTGGMMNDDPQLVSNPLTGASLSVQVQGTLNNSMLFARYILDDADYAALTAGLNDEWRETQTFFNVENVADTYPFAKQLFNDIVDGSDAACETASYYDRVVKALDEANGEVYWGDTESADDVDYDLRDSSEFRLYWKYMPQFRVLDQADFVQTMAVYLMLFIFIALICFAAVIVISYTRCLTLTYTNARVYEDLRRLGASRAYLYHALRSQLLRVWGVPALVGTAVIFAFFTMIMYFNTNSISASEAAGLLVCLGIVAVISALLYACYRISLRQSCRILDI